MDVNLRGFLDAMEREYGYRPHLLPGGILINSRDQDRYEGWMLAMGPRSPDRDAYRYRALRNAPNNSPDSGVEILFWKRGKGTITAGKDLDVAADHLIAKENGKTTSYQESDTTTGGKDG